MILDHPGTTPDPSALLWTDAQRAYRAKRRRWAWRVGLPYSEDLDKPEPGTLDQQTDEEG